MLGGYVILDMSDVIVNGAASANINVTVPKSIVSKLRSWGKPLFISNFNATIDGTVVKFEGFTTHDLTAGVHHHSLTSCDIAVMGDTQIQIVIEI